MTTWTECFLNITFSISFIQIYDLRRFSWMFHYTTDWSTVNYGVLGAHQLYPPNLTKADYRSLWVGISLSSSHNVFSLEMPNCRGSCHWIKTKLIYPTFFNTCQVCIRFHCTCNFYNEQGYVYAQNNSKMMTRSWTVAVRSSAKKQLIWVWSYNCRI